MTGPSAAIAPNVDDEVSFTCTFTSADIATTVKLMPGELISKTVLAATSSLIIKVLAQKDTDYVCLVVYSDYGERESEALEVTFLLLNNEPSLYIFVRLRRGVFRLIILETLIMRYGLKGKARTRPDFFRLVLGPCAQFYPCEATEQKWGQTSKS